MHTLRPTTAHWTFDNFSRNKSITGDLCLIDGKIISKQLGHL